MLTSLEDLHGNDLEFKEIHDIVFKLNCLPSSEDDRAKKKKRRRGADVGSVSNKQRLWAGQTGTEDGTHLVPLLEVPVINLLLNLLDETGPEANQSEMSAPRPPFGRICPVVYHCHWGIPNRAPRRPRRRKTRRRARAGANANATNVTLS